MICVIMIPDSQPVELKLAAKCNHCVHLYVGNDGARWNHKAIKCLNMFSCDGGCHFCYDGSNLASYEVVISENKKERVME